VRKNVFLCGPCGKSGNAWRLAAFLAKEDPQNKRAVARWLTERGLLDPRGRENENGNGNEHANGNGHAKHDSSRPSKQSKADFARVAEFSYGPDLRKVRWERPSEDAGAKPEKTFRWEHRSGEKWAPGDGGLQKPLYANAIFRKRDLLDLAVGFEGEAKCDLAGELGFAGFSFKNLTADLCDAFADLDVVLWPDADGPGLKQAAGAAQLIADSGESRRVRLIIPPVELPIAGDIVDAVRSLRWGRDRIERLIAEARAFPAEPEPVGLLLSEVAQGTVDWLWEGRIPRRALTVLDGDPGLGKSLLTLDVAARVSRGTPLPGTFDGRVEPRGVVILSAEDSISHVIKPRLCAAGADMTRVLAVPYSPEKPGQVCISKFPVDIPILERAIERVGAVLVILDVLVSYIPATLSTQRDQDVRLVLAPLANVCDKYNAALFGLRHLNKSATGPILYRGGGSIGIGGAARSNVLLAADPNDAKVRVLAGVKSNYGPLPGSLSFTIKITDGQPHIEWIGSSTHSAESLLADQAGGAEDRGARDEARSFLDQELADGPKEAKRILETAKSLGIAEKTLRRAKESLAESKKVGETWFWGKVAKETNRAE